MMMIYRGGQKAQKGDYWNYATGEKIHVDEESVLPGGRKVIFFKAHPVVVVLAGPFLGLVYAVFLPLIGIVMLLSIVTRKVFGWLLAQLGQVAGVRWNPNEAYLSGRKETCKEKPREETDLKES
jgi:hypothetical protein